MYFGCSAVRLIGFEVPNHCICYAVCPGHRVLLALLEPPHTPLFQQRMRLKRRHIVPIPLGISFSLSLKALRHCFGTEVRIS